MTYLVRPFIVEFGYSGKSRIVNGSRRYNIIWKLEIKFIKTFNAGRVTRNCNATGIFGYPLLVIVRILVRRPFDPLRLQMQSYFLIKLQQEDGKSYSSIHTIRDVLRSAFQMTVDDDILVKNPFGFQFAGCVNNSVTREAISKDQMRKFLKFVHNDVVYCKYYEVVYILLHTGMRISEFCGLTFKDIDLDNRVVNIDHQLQRTADMRYIIEETKTEAGKRKIPITKDVA